MSTVHSILAILCAISVPLNISTMANASALGSPALWRTGLVLSLVNVVGVAVNLLLAAVTP